MNNYGGLRFRNLWKMDLRVFEEKVMVFKGYLMSYLMNIWWKYAEFWAQLWVLRA